MIVGELHATNNMIKTFVYGITTPCLTRHYLDQAEGFQCIPQNSDSSLTFLLVQSLSLRLSMEVKSTGKSKAIMPLL